MKKIVVLTLAITGIILLSSCEGGTTFIKKIDNRTDETISVKLHTIYGSNDETTINPNEIKQLFWDDQMGNFVDNSYTCTQFIDSIEIHISNNKVLTKDIMDSNNWERVSKGGRNSMEDCKFVIFSEDIQ